MSYYEFPHSRTYDQDLGWLIEKVNELEARVKALEEKETETESETK